MYFKIGLVEKMPDTNKIIRLVLKRQFHLKSFTTAMIYHKTTIVTICTYDQGLTPRVMSLQLYQLDMPLIQQQQQKTAFDELNYV